MTGSRHESGRRSADLRALFTRMSPTCGLMGDVSAPMSVPAIRPMSLVVTVAGLEPGAPMDAAVRLADALDARRVPLTLLAGARPHPEVRAWAAARRRAGDAVLLLGAGDGDHRSLRRLPGHEAGLRLAGALRARDGAGLEVDGFAAPGWSVSDGVRAALSAAGVDLLVDDTGVHRLGEGGAVGRSVAGAVIASRAELAPATSRWPVRARRRRTTAVRHHAHAVTAASPDGHDEHHVLDALLRAVDADLEAGAVPDTAPGLVSARRSVPRPVPRARDLGDPEFWSITA